MVVNIKRMEEIMAIRGITLTRICKKGGVDHSTMSKIMAGGDVRPVIVHRIAQAMGIDVTELFGRLEQPQVPVVLGTGAKMPTRAHNADAGLDLYSPVEMVIYPGDSVTIDTGVSVGIPLGYVGFLKSKSGLNVRHGITSEGVIDAGYTGTIAVKLYNHGNVIFRIDKGMKISQLVLLPIITPELVRVESLSQTERGTGGFGSTGAY